MPRPRSDFPSYRLHAASGQAVVTLTDPDGSRQDVLLGKHNSAESKKEYDRVIQSWVAAGRRLHAVAGDITNAQVLVRYVEEHRGKYDTGFSNGQVVNLRSVVRLVRGLFGAEEARLMSPKRLKEIRKAMVERGWTLRHVNQQVSRVKSIYRWAVSEELIPGEVIHALDAVKSLAEGEQGLRSNPDVKPVPEEVVEATLPHLPPMVADLVRVMLLSGARCAEVCILRACDVDRSDPNAWVYRPTRHKTKYRKKERFVYLGREAQAVLAKWLDESSPEAYVFSPEVAERMRHAERSERRKVKRWPSHARHNAKRRARSRPKQYAPHYSAHAISQRIGIVCDRLDARLRRERDPADLRDSKDVPEAERLFPSWSVNQIRHTAGTRVRKRFGAEVAQLFLGHSHLSTTEIYAEPDREAVKRAVVEMG